MAAVILLVGCSTRMIEKKAVELDAVKLNVLGVRLFLYPGVYPPDMSSVFLLKNVMINDGDEVLDLGTGTGIQAIFAARGARRVVATDIDPLAVENARDNVAYHGLEGKIEVRQGDLFEPISPDERFNVIIFSPCFPREVPEDTNEILNGTFTDRCWDVTLRFFSEAEGHLKEGGRIFYLMGFEANMPHVRRIIAENELRIKNSSAVLLDEVMYEVFELTPLRASD